MVILKDTVRVEGSAPNGYRLYLSASHPHESGRSLLNSAQSGGKIRSTTGTQNVPTVLDDNTWGYAISDRHGSGNRHYTKFDVDYEDGSVPIQRRRFAAIPALSQPDLLQDTDNLPGTRPRSIAVFYGIRVNDQLPQGNYVTKLLYTVIADSPPLIPTNSVALPQPAHVAKLTPKTGNTSTATPLTITTNLSFADTNNAQLSLPHPAFPQAVLDDISVKVGSRDCESPNYSLVDSYLTISCTTPRYVKPGVRMVTIRVPAFSKTYNAEFTYQQPTFKGIKTMQEMTPAICDSEPTPSVKAINTSRLHVTQASGQSTLVPEAELIDVRDQKTYIIRKLADGNCWMSQNLDLGDTEVTINAQTSDYEGAPFKLGPAETSDNHTKWSDSSDDVASLKKLRIYNRDNQDIDDRYARDAAIYYPPDGVTQRPSDLPATRHTGNSYNWYTATAKSGTNTTIDTDARYSICPKGWALPSVYDWNRLLSSTYKLDTSNACAQMTGAEKQACKKKMAYLAQTLPLSLSNTGGYGNSYFQPSYEQPLNFVTNFWSRTASKDYNSGAYNVEAMHLEDDQVDDTGSAHKVMGWPIRCVIKRPVIPTTPATSYYP